MARSLLRCRILAVGDFPEGGATSQRLHLLAKLMSQGFEDVSLWILHPTMKMPVKENGSIAGEWGGVKFVYLNNSTVRPAGLARALFDTIKGIYGSVCVLVNHKERPDVLVVYTPSFFKFLIPVVVARLLRIPIIVEMCEVLSTSTDKRDAGIFRRLANSGEFLMERLIPLVAAGLVVISRKIRQYYTKRGLPDDAAYLLPVLIDFDLYDRSVHAPVENLQSTQYLLNSGSFSEKDGLPQVVRAVARVREEYPDIKLVFTGNATLSTQRKILESSPSKGEEWIIFTGFLSRDKLIWCYKNARGLLCCRSNSVYANYGFPTKLAEYLASSRPVIATTVGDVDEYLVDEKSAFLAKPENVESIADAIRRLLSDPKRADNVGRTGAKVALQYFDYRNYAETLARFIRRRIGATPDGL